MGRGDISSMSKKYSAALACGRTVGTPWSTGCWIGCLLVARWPAGLAWTAIAQLRGSTRTEYRTLLAWLRFFFRLTVGFFMIAYGMLKVFPLQMPTIPLPFSTIGRRGDHAPNFLWSLVGLYPLYEVICGVTEVIAGTLVLFRRTALIGTLLQSF